MMSELNNRNLPQVLRLESGAMVRDAADWSIRRGEIRALLESELFGALPEVEHEVQFDIRREESTYYNGGKSIFRHAGINVTAGGKRYGWELFCALPKSSSPVPVFLLIGFGNRFGLIGTTPTEEINDGGFGVAILDYQQVSSDDGDFTNGLAGMFYPDGCRGAHQGGKIAIWAWAMKRSLDCLLTMPEVDPGRVIATGHSRLGKTALWAAATDERFYGAYSNDSGCSGASLARGNTGEQVRDITGRFPFWFAPAYARYADCVEQMPFDQHELLALVAPRRLYVASAAGDLWADPVSEYLGCLAVTPVYELLGKRGVSPAREPGGDDVLHEGTVGYHRRPGTHYLGRLDWQRAMAFFGREG